MDQIGWPEKIADVAKNHQLGPRNNGLQKLSDTAFKMGEISGELPGVDLHVKLLRKQRELCTQNPRGDQIFFEPPPQNKDIVCNAEPFCHVAFFLNHGHPVGLHGTVAIAIDQLLFEVNISIMYGNILTKEIHQSVLPIGIETDKPHDFALKYVQV